MDLATMVARVRRNLRDEDDENYRWTDDELERHIARAVVEFSEAVPLQQKTVKATTVDEWTIDISSLTDRIKIYLVEYPIGEVPIYLVRFSLWGDTLTILGEETPDGSDCNIYWGTVHTLDAVSSTVPTRFEELIAMGAAGYALVAWGDYALNQVNLGGPATAADFRDSGDAKLHFFRSELKRQGERNSAVVTSLYSPALPQVSETRDPGP